MAEAEIRAAETEIRAGETEIRDAAEYAALALGGCPAYRCRRATFEPGEYEKYGASFWAMPTQWVASTGPSFLAAIYRAGGVGALSVLPVLGQFAHARWAHECHLSQEELARLAGVDPGTVTKARHALARLGLAEAVTENWMGARLLRWTLAPALAAARTNGAFSEDRFYFSARLIYGGNWARMTGVQRAVYLALATQARTFSEVPIKNPLLNASGVPLGNDMISCYDSVAARTPRTDEVNADDWTLAKGWLRLTRVSYTELERATGLSRSAILRAVAALPRPEPWDSAASGPPGLRCAPLAVYETRQRSLLFAFRDHADHWPWDVLNTRAQRRTTAHV